MPMTVQEMDQDLEQLRSYLSVCPGFRIERCTHKSVEFTSLWVFDSKTGKQVASVSRNYGTFSKYHWTAQKMIGGQPVTNLPFERLLDVAGYLVRCC